MKEWLISELGKWEPVREVTNPAYISTLTVVIDRMERIAKEKKPKRMKSQRYDLFLNE
jgi:hypothetical protein